MGQTDIGALGFNVGNEFDLDMVVNGQIISELGLLESRGRKANVTLLESKPTNNRGYIVRRAIHDGGYTMEFHLTRQNDAFDDLVDALDAAYHGGTVPIFFTGTETIINGGNVSQWVYSRGTMVPDSLGTPKGGERVDDIMFSVHFTSRSKTIGSSSAPTLQAAAGL